MNVWASKLSNLKPLKNQVHSQKMAIPYGRLGEAAPSWTSRVIPSSRTSFNCCCNSLFNLATTVPSFLTVSNQCLKCFLTFPTNLGIEGCDTRTAAKTLVLCVCSSTSCLNSSPNCVNTCITYNPTIPKCTHTRRFTAVLFIIAQNWKQPKYPSIVQWVSKLWSIY